MLIYVDNNATTPMADEVVDEVCRIAQHVWGNPISNNTVGENAKSVIEQSREKLGRMIDGRAEDIVFMSGGTEANNVALLSGISNRKLEPLRPHVITSNVEHDSVKKYLEALEQKDEIELSLASVDTKTGMIGIETVFGMIKENTCLVSIMHANNETGVIMPIDKIGKELKILNESRLSNGAPYIFFHSDAAQTIGKIPVSVEDLGVDYLTIVGHKFYGPRIGALYARNVGVSTPVVSLLVGGGQERGFRPGTENTAMIGGLGIAASLVTSNISQYHSHMMKCRDFFQDKLNKESIQGMKVNFVLEDRLPNTLSITLPPNLIGSQVLKACSKKFVASLGAACHSNIQTPSNVLIKSGLTIEEANRTIRFSVGRDTTLKDIELIVKTLCSECLQVIEN